MSATPDTSRVLRWELNVDDEDHAFDSVVGQVLAAAAKPTYASYAVVEFWTWQDAPSRPALRTFRVFGTGHPVPAGYEWRASCPRDQNGLVWHLAERVDEYADIRAVAEGPSGEGSGSERDVVLAAVAPIAQAAIARARAEALLEASEALEGGLGIEGTPRDLYEFRHWLRDRAAALDVPAPAQGAGHEFVHTDSDDLTDIEICACGLRFSDPVHRPAAPASPAARVCCKTEIRTDEQRSAWSTYWNQTGRCLTCEVPVAGGITRIGSAATAAPASAPAETSAPEGQPWTGITPRLCRGHWPDPTTTWRAWCSDCAENCCREMLCDGCARGPFSAVTAPPALDGPE